MLKIEQNSSNTRFCKRFDFILWTFLAILPLATWLFYLLGIEGVEPITFEKWMYSYFGLQPLSAGDGNIVYDTLAKIFLFGSKFLPSMTRSGVLFFTWFCSIEIVHILVDVLLFVARLAHKWIGGLIS